MVAHVPLAERGVHLLERAWEAFEVVLTACGRARVVSHELPDRQGRSYPRKEAGGNLSCGRGDGRREGKGVDGGFKAEEEDSEDAVKSHRGRCFHPVRRIRVVHTARITHINDSWWCGVVVLTRFDRV